jgi:hypothetical protein
MFDIHAEIGVSVGRLLIDVGATWQGARLGLYRWQQNDDRGNCTGWGLRVAWFYFTAGRMSRSQLTVRDV